MESICLSTDENDLWTCSLLWAEDPSHLDCHWSTCPRVSLPTDPLTLTVCVWLKTELVALLLQISTKRPIQTLRRTATVTDPMILPRGADSSHFIHVLYYQTLTSHLIDGEQSLSTLLPAEYRPSTLEITLKKLLEGRIDSEDQYSLHCVATVIGLKDIRVDASVNEEALSLANKLRTSLDDLATIFTASIDPKNSTRELILATVVNPRWTMDQWHRHVSRRCSESWTWIYLSLRICPFNSLESIPCKQWPSSSFSLANSVRNCQLCSSKVHTEYQSRNVMCERSVSWSVFDVSLDELHQSKKERFPCSISKEGCSALARFSNGYCLWFLPCYRTLRRYWQDIPRLSWWDLLLLSNTTGVGHWRWITDRWFSSSIYQAMDCEPCVKAKRFESIIWRVLMSGLTMPICCIPVIWKRRHVELWRNDSVHWKCRRIVSLVTLNRFQPPYSLIFGKNSKKSRSNSRSVKQMCSCWTISVWLMVKHHSVILNDKLQ